MKSGILSGSLTRGVHPKVSTNISQPIIPDHVVGSSTSSISLNDSWPLLTQRNTEKPSPLPGLRSSISLSCTITSDATPSGSNLFASLLNTLVAKGLISSSKAESATSFPSLSQKPSNQVPTDSTTTNLEVPKFPVPSSSSDSLASSEPAACLSDVEPQAQKTEMECLLGFEFRPDIFRQFHSTVIDQLFYSFHYICSICGLSLKLRKRLDRHLEWHALKQLKPDNSKMASRRWFSKSAEWVAGKTELTSGFTHGSLKEQSKVLAKDSEPMVPADETWCLCLLCGELFEDVYSQETDQWMFKGTVFMTNPSEKGGQESSTSRRTRTGTIVKCMSDKVVHDMGLASNVKLERDV